MFIYKKIFLINNEKSKSPFFALFLKYTIYLVIMAEYTTHKNRIK